MSDNKKRALLKLTDSKAEDNSAILSILQNIGERFKSPFFFSFIISWCVTNWKILVCLFFYDRADLLIIGPNLTKIKFIEEQITWQASLFWPIVCALAYCFIWPIARNEIENYQASFRIKANTRILKATQGASLPFEPMLERTKQYRLAQQELRELVAQESVILDENKTLKQKVRDVESKFNDAIKHINNIEEWFRPDLINGEWQSSDSSYDLNFFILKNSKVFQKNRMSLPQTHSLENFLANHLTRDISFTIVALREPELTKRFLFKLSEDGQLLESRSTHPSFTKIKNSKLLEQVF